MNHPLRRTRAFSLVEVTLALGVMAFCLVAVMGLLPVSFNSNRAAVEQTAAAGLAAALATDLRQASATVPWSPRFLINLPTTTSLQTASTIHTIFLTEDGAVADAYDPSVSPPTTASSAEDRDANISYNPRYRATLVFSRQLASATDRTATSVRILLTWPASADPRGATSDTTYKGLPQHASGSFETIIALDRN